MDATLSPARGVSVLFSKGKTTKVGPSLEILWKFTIVEEQKLKEPPAGILISSPCF
ncbi:MAG: hypothetical protein ABDH29_08295 [Aquificaceae bacterium]